MAAILSFQSNLEFTVKNKVKILTGRDWEELISYYVFPDVYIHCILTLKRNFRTTDVAGFIGRLIKVMVDVIWPT